MSLSVGFFDGYPVDVVVSAERNNLQVRCNIMHNASPNPIHVEVVAVHESHAAKQKDSASNFS